MARKQDALDTIAKALAEKSLTVESYSDFEGEIENVADHMGVDFILCIGKDGTNYSRGFAGLSGEFLENYFCEQLPVAAECKFKTKVFAI